MVFIVRELDSKDHKILYHLFLNSRQSLSSVAKKVGLQKSVVEYRIKRLQTKGIIKNFYAEFLAALDVVNNYKAYFGDIAIKQSLRADVVPIERNMLAREIEKYCSITKDEIKRLNPSLQSDAIESRISLPKGFMFRIPEGRKEAFYKGFEVIVSRQAGKKESKKTEASDKLKEILGDSKGVSF